MAAGRVSRDSAACNNDATKSKVSERATLGLVVWAWYLHDQAKFCHIYSPVPTALCLGLSALVSGASIPLRRSFHASQLFVAHARSSRSSRQRLSMQRAAQPRAMSVATCLLLQPRPFPRVMPSPRACVVLASCPPQGLLNALRHSAAASEQSPAHRAPRRALWLATRSAARSASSRRVRAVEVRTLLSNPVCLVSHLVAQASAGAAAGGPVTVWVKRTDVPGAQYVSVKGVDLQQTVDGFKARLVVEDRLTVRPSLVTLRLVKCGARNHEVDDKAQADVLDDPRLTLAAVGITEGSSLLADTVQLALLAIEREEEAERQRAERRARRGAHHCPCSTS